MTILKLQKGLTLLEALLTLAIASMLLVLSLRMYESYALDSYISELQYNVDSLFQAMSLYYKVNCAGTYNTNGEMTVWGTLNPVNPPNPAAAPSVATQTARGASAPSTFDSEWGNFLIGNASGGFSQASIDPVANINENRIEFYGQDDWRVSPRLTVK